MWEIGVKFAENTRFYSVGRAPLVDWVGMEFGVLRIGEFWRVSAEVHDQADQTVCMPHQRV